ncbi:MAG: sulfotransferase family 2 domain-containing protein [Patescibacteria group bacterium]
MFKYLIRPIYSPIQYCNLVKFLNYNIEGGYKRIYHFHIRKTGGTSINNAFLSLGGKKGNEVYKKLYEKNNSRLLSGNYVFVGWHKRLIRRGNYFYAFSHQPCHKISLPEKTFTFTCLRDPLNRIISHYKMLLEYKVNNINHPCMKKEGKWLGDNFGNFLDNIPKNVLLNQVHMFSKKLDVDEAFNNIKNCSFFFFTENFEQGMNELSKTLNLPLTITHDRKSVIKPKIDQEYLKKAKIVLKPEIYLYNKLKNYKLRKDY